jgi:hypothetical protein
MTTHKNLLDDLVPDPAGLPELCDASEFTELITGMVADQAPRLFAIVEEYGTRVNARVAGWGLAYEDHVDVIGVDGGIHLGAANPEKILRRFGWRDRIKAHLVWPSAGPDPVTE